VDPRERIVDHEELLRQAMDSHQAGIWTAIPAIIQSFNAAAQTCAAQPAIQGRFRDQNGNLVYSNLPLLLDCPVIFPSGGGYSLTFPINAGDECLVIFASRCIDAWWQQGTIGKPLELRMHDLSDGFALPGCRSKPRAISNISTTALQLRTDDGATFIQIAPNGQVKISAKDVKVHAANSYAWDIYGYGQKITYNGGVSYTIDNYVNTAVVTTVNHNINQPDAT